jgi:hypothetical protein
MDQGQFRQEWLKHDWTRWRYRAGNFASLKTASPLIPCRHGVYIVRAPALLPRVRGSSEVVYIGQSGGGKRGGKQGIGPGNGGPGRLFNTRGADEVVREKVEALFDGQEFILECTFVEKEDPESIETRLLRAYFEDHCELPPANHNKRAVSDSLAQNVA